MHNPGLPMEWNISDQIRRETSGLAQSHEVHALKSHVDRLEHSLRETGSSVDELRSQLQETAQAVTNLTEIVSGLLDRIACLEGDEPENDLVRTNGPLGVGA